MSKPDHAGNRNTPPEILTQLAQDTNKSVRQAPLDNPNFPDHLQALAKLAG